MNHLMAIIISLFSLAVFAEEWVSPIDEKYLNKSPELFSDYSRARDIINSWRGQNEELVGAEIILRRVLEEDADFAPAHREYGRLYMAAGHINRGNYREGSLSSAEESILKSLEIEPYYADSYVLLGHLYTRMDRHGDADAALDKAELIGTNYPWLPLNRAELLMERRQYDEALSLYKSVIESGTTNRKAYSSALSRMTTAYRYLNQFDKADEGYKAQLEYEPNSAHTWGNYSDFLLYQLGDVDGAILNGKKALSIMNYGMGRFTLACALYTKWALLRQDADSSAEAQRYFDEAWALYPFPERVFQKTSRHEHTHITAVELVKWKASQSLEDSEIHGEE